MNRTEGFFRGLVFSAGLLALFEFAPAGLAQVGVAQVTFNVALPANTPEGDTIYVAGNFQNWDPAATPLTRDDAPHAHGTITPPAHLGGILAAAMVGAGIRALTNA